MKNIFDTHAHYDDERFDEDRDELLSSLKDKGVIFVVNCGCDLKTCLKTIRDTHGRTQYMAICIRCDTTA